MFGCSFDLGAAGLGDLRGDTLVPGVAVFSRRAMPLAAWTNGLEIAGARAAFFFFFFLKRSFVARRGCGPRWRLRCAGAHRCARGQ
jgi:hypothetical protein